MLLIKYDLSNVYESLDISVHIVYLRGQVASCVHSMSHCQAAEGAEGLPILKVGV